MIVCFGDSITAGQFLDPWEAWPQLLDTKEIIPAGIPGETTRMALERFPRDVQQVGPEMVVIQFGHNDSNRWQTDRGLPRVSPLAFRANLVEMIARSRAFSIKPLLCTLTPSHRSPEHGEDVVFYDQIIREVAQTQNVSLIDVRAEFMAYNRAKLLLMEDGLHLSRAGHRLYAATVQQALDREGTHDPSDGNRPSERPSRA